MDMPQSFGGHGQGALVWMPDLSQLTDIALQIKMRAAAGAREVGRHMSPIRSVTPQGRAHGGRPSTDLVQKGSALPTQTDPPHCVSVECPCTATHNGEPGEHCCITCRRGQLCADNYHKHPTKRVRVCVLHCATESCPCTSTFNGQPGEACCRTCQRGTPCADNYHPHHGRWCRASHMDNARNNNSMRCRRSRVTCNIHQARMHKAPCHLSSISLRKQIMMKVTCMSYMGPKYHRHMRNTIRMGNCSRCRHRWFELIEQLLVTLWWLPLSLHFMSCGLCCRCSSDLWTATWNKSR